MTSSSLIGTPDATSIIYLSLLKIFIFHIKWCFNCIIIKLKFCYCVLLRFSSACHIIFLFVQQFVLTTHDLRPAYTLKECNLTPIDTPVVVVVVVVVINQQETLGIIIPI
ncbi:hypothetical protein GQX74_014794 [Glossina fuscipes]|nr:hypothetical protein GQX74_014794 [Glossina fuscipes]